MNQRTISKLQLLGLSDKLVVTLQSMLIFLAEADVPSRLLAVYMLAESSKDLKDKSKKSLKHIIQMCTHLPALEPLLQLAPNNILTYVCAQFAKVLPSNLEAKRTFVQSGGFQKIQEIQAEP